jgi:hypothetical protein
MMMPIDVVFILGVAAHESVEVQILATIQEVEERALFQHLPLPVAHIILPLERSTQRILDLAAIAAQAEPAGRIDDRLPSRRNAR